MNENEKFAERIDWTSPLISDAAQLYHKGDTDGAIHAVIEHFRTRKNPVYLFDAKDAGACNDPQVMVEADETMHHIFYGHQFGKEINWMENPTADTSHDNEFSWSIYRTIFWQPLVRAYGRTKDPKYVREFVLQMRSFVSAWPAEPVLADPDYEKKFTFPGQAWRTIESGIRIYTTWLPCFETFRSSAELDDESFVIFLNAMHDHATFLSTHYSNHKSSSNWLSMEVTALLQLGIMFPEFKASKDWYVLGYRRMSHEVLYGLDENGIHMERTPVYHMVAVLSYLQSYLLLTKNHLPVPPYMFPLLEKGLAYVMHLVKPDLTTPMIGDADREDFKTSRADLSAYEGMNLSFFPEDLNEIRGAFSLMAKLTGRKDFLYFASQYQQGKAPKELDYNLHEGIYLMRSGWSAKDSYLLVHGVRLERGEKSSHSHVDQGHVELQVNGEDILVDCGRYIYNSSCWKDWRHYFTFQTAHNTLDVDGHEMGQTPGQTERMRGVRTYLHAFQKEQNFWLIDISHNGYAFLEDPVYLRRKVLRLNDETVVIFDHITGLSGADHDFKEYYNFAPGTMELEGEQAQYHTEKGTTFTSTFLSSKEIKRTLLQGSENPKGGWLSLGYTKRIAIPQVTLSYHGKAPFSMVTVIQKEGNSEGVSLTVTDESVRGKIGKVDINLSDDNVTVEEGK